MSLVHSATHHASKPRSAAASCTSERRDSSGGASQASLLSRHHVARVRTPLILSRFSASRARAHGPLTEPQREQIAASG